MEPRCSICGGIMTLIPEPPPGQCWLEVCPLCSHGRISELEAQLAAARGEVAEWKARRDDALAAVVRMEEVADERHAKLVKLADDHRATQVDVAKLVEKLRNREETLEHAQASLGLWMERADAAQAESRNLREALKPYAPELDWREARFTFYDSPGEHDPCFIVMPGGNTLPLNHHATPGVDIARAKWIIDACNARLPWVIDSWRQEEAGWKAREKDLEAESRERAGEVLALRLALEKASWAIARAQLRGADEQEASDQVEQALASTSTAAAKVRGEIVREALEEAWKRVSNLPFDDGEGYDPAAEVIRAAILGAG